MPQPQLDEVTAYDEFMIAGRLDADARAKLAGILQDQYRHNATNLVTVADHVHQTLTRLRADWDKIRRGVFREEFWANYARSVTGPPNHGCGPRSI